MIEVNGIVKVPPRQALRNHLRKEVRLFVSGKEMKPLTRLDILTQYAEQILKDSGLNGAFLDFTIVLLGNEIWRDYLKAVPYHRRLLLLPQCLRNRESCQGVFDEMGLICSGCKNCRIDEILNRAEALGYTTLVAEGTSVALGLIEEGAIDAVIGVSCMSVLQRSFQPVNHAAVPGIGIPLLNDGCENTTLDYEWVMEELEYWEDEPAKRPLSLSLLKNQVGTYFQLPSLQSFFSRENETEQLALKMMGMGGQRIRPLLAVLAYLSYTSAPREEVQKLLAVFIECFHKASLVHDDIEDDEAFRYGHPVLHRTEGIPVAINIGDYLVGKGYQLLSQTPVEPDVLVEGLRMVSESHLSLSEGQGADILLNSDIPDKSLEDVLRIFQLKTGEAVKVALLCGAILGKAPDEEKKKLELFSEYFGIAYQIRDDLNEFREEDSSENPFHFPFLLVLLRDKMLEKQEVFPGFPGNDMTRLRAKILSLGIDVLAGDYLNFFMSRCYSELDKLQNQKLRFGLYGIMGKVFKHTIGE